MRPSSTAGVLCLLTALSALASPAAAAEDECALHRPVPVTRLYWKLSIDLRGHVPAIEEYDALADLPDDADLPDEIVEGMLSSEEFRLAMREYHRSLLFPVLSAATASFKDQGNLLSPVTLAAAGGEAEKSVLHSPSQGRRGVYRGGDKSHACQNKPQSALGYEADGTPTCEAKGSDAAGAYCQEGFVEVKPYWEADPTKTVFVCAFDAQDLEQYTLNGNKYACSDNQATSRKECGCGANLNYCFRNINDHDNMVRGAMEEQLLLLVDDVTTGKQPYDYLFTTKDTYMTGVLDHYYRYQSRLAGTGRMFNGLHQDDAQPVDKPDWHDATWRKASRDGLHSGVLTLPAFTLRYQTNRGRANKVYQILMGKYFTPPEPKDDNCATEGSDLTQRCVCRKCHQKVEPMAAYFGAIAEAGSGLLNDLPASVKTSTDCNNLFAPASSAWCRRFYSQIKDDKGATVEWRQWALEFSPAHPEYDQNYAQGPGGLFEEAAAKIGDEPGLFYQATVRHLFNYLMKREMNLDPGSADNERDLLIELAAELESDPSFPRLVKRLVNLPAYRRMP